MIPYIISLYPEKVDDPLDQNQQPNSDKDTGKKDDKLFFVQQRKREGNGKCHQRHHSINR